jgi:sigma-B regulation protein RsbU (phosphoserine phosphatase)
MSELGPIDDYKDLFENAPCGYLTIGSDGRITKVNTTLAAWTVLTLTNSSAGVSISS